LKIFLSRNFPVVEQNGKRFKFYCVYAFGLLTMIVLLFTGENLKLSIVQYNRDLLTNFFLGLYAVNALVDIILLVLTAVRIYKNKGEASAHGSTER
jgi:hypothetical protein